MDLFDESIRGAIGKNLLQKMYTLSVAESVTGGLLQLAFSTMTDASRFFQGGLTAYNLGQKAKHLSVEPIHAIQVNCVSQQVANEMAEQVRIMFSSDWGIAVTGYASPVPESDHSLFAYYAITSRGKIEMTGKLEPPLKEPFAVQRYYTNQILQQFDFLLKGI